MPTILDARTALVLQHPDKPELLLLRRAPTKKLLPNLISGIGGEVEFTQGEAKNIEASLWREVQEETSITPDIVENCHLGLITLVKRHETTYILYWFFGKLLSFPPNLNCTDGKLEWHPIANLPLQDFTATAAQTIPYILQNPSTCSIGHFIEKHDKELLIVE